MSNWQSELPIRDSKIHCFLSCTISKSSFHTTKMLFSWPNMGNFKTPSLMGASAPHKFPTITNKPIVNRSASHTTIFRKNYTNFFRNTKVISNKGDKAKCRQIAFKLRVFEKSVIHFSIVWVIRSRTCSDILFPVLCEI